MFSMLLRGAAPLLLILSAPAAAQTAAPITPADMMRHIEVLASDNVQGRMPGTEGEASTIAYIAAQLQARGVEPGGPEGGWYQPVPLVERTPLDHRAGWSANGRPVPFDSANILLQGRGAEERVEAAPVVFAGHGVSMPEKGIDQLAGVDFGGKVALILLRGPDIPGFPSLQERVRTVSEAGAAAVIAIVGPDVPWEAVTGAFGRPTTRLAGAELPPITGAMPFAAVQSLVEAAGGDMAALLDEQPGPSFRAVPLPLSATIEVRTAVRPYTSHNVIGRIPGSGARGENLLYLGHWDHLGICRPEGVEDRICNGAVDNASGIAMMIEIAGRLAEGPGPERNVLFLATTAEEMGLLGAEHFAEEPPVPLDSIVAAINLDTVAIHPAGATVGVIGRGIAPLDEAIAETAAAMGRTLDTTYAADVMVTRQDGWALVRAGVPAVMVGGAFTMEVLQPFLADHYHGPEDDLDREIVLEGAAEDADLLVALGRRLADPELYQRPER